MKKTILRGLPSNPAPLIAILIFFSFAGCAPKPSSLSPQPDYYQTLNRWTTGKKVFDGMESRLYIYATYKSLPYRKAYVDEYAKRYQMDEGHKGAFLSKEIETHE
ncbi:MAG: hypothetical protein HY883_05570, partial [Deltaproteobacteria bacterium]|nr:hypothetical protein [Deltaproteobacteria bacterium]